MIKLIEKRASGLDLVTHLNNNKTTEMAQMYQNEETKKAIGLAISENKQEDLLRIINVQIIKDTFTNEIFFNEYVEEIANNLDNNLSFENLELEYSMFMDKYNALGNPQASFEEVMLYEYDKDKMLYDKDINVMKKLLKANKNIYIYGGKGNGKSYFATNQAKEMGLKLFTITNIKTQFDVEGGKDLQSVYQYSLIEDWYINGGLLMLDECDSYNANALLMLNTMIERGNKTITLKSGEVLTKNENCYIIACANTNGNGRTQEYVARNVMDSAFLDRFIKKEFKEYTYLHKMFLKENYAKVKAYFQDDLSVRTSKKINDLLKEFAIDELLEMIDNEEFAL